MVPPTPQVASDVLTLLSVLGVISLLISVHFASPILTDAGELPPQKVRLLTIGVTIGATLFTMLVSGRIQHGILRSIENPIRKSGLDDPLASGIGLDDESEPMDTQRQQTSLEELDRRWRGYLRIDNLREMVYNWPALLIFMLAGLNTTSIVTSLTPSLTIYQVAYSPIIPDTSFGADHGWPLHPCFGVSQDPVSGGWYSSWKFSDGSVFYANLNDAGCPPSFSTFLAPAINKASPDDYAYTDLGVAIDRTAMGTPSAVYNGSMLREASSKYGLSLNHTSQCVPVMKSTPFQYKSGGAKLKVISSNKLRLKMTALNRTTSYDCVYSRNFTVDSAMINMIMPYTATPDQVLGDSVLALGGYTDPEGKTPFANEIAQTVNDPDHTAGNAGRSTYTVTCLVSPAGSFEYRTVILGRNSNKTPYLFGGGPCTPTTPTISNKMFVTVTAATTHILREGKGSDGYLETLMNIAGGYRGPPYAFNNSRSALEDSLGVLAAMVVSRMPLDGAVVADAVDDPAYAKVQATRLGSDSAEILFLLIPPAGCFLILAYLFKQSFRTGWQPGGDLYRGLGRSQRPRQYAAESLVQLLRLRKTSLSRIDSLDLSSTPMVDVAVKMGSRNDE